MRLKRLTTIRSPYAKENYLNRVRSLARSVGIENFRNTQFT